MDEKVNGDISRIHPYPGDVLVFKFSPECSPTELDHYYNLLLKVFPNNIILAMPDDSNIEAWDKSSLIKMLQQAINVLSEEENND